MAEIMTQVRIPARSLIPADDIVNTFNFVGTADAVTMAPLAREMVRAFYNDLASLQTEPVKNYLSGELNPSAAQIKIYDHADPEPRVPLYDGTLGVTGPAPVGTGNLPAEVAIALSYLAEQESGVPAGRRRGRIYIGPLRSGASEGSSATTTRPAGSALTNISRAAAELASGPIGCRWAVYSRRDEAFRQILNGYLDNAFDTQRRRGPDTTSRVAFTGGLG